MDREEEMAIRRSERLRCVGLVLGHMGKFTIAGRKSIADALDALATDMEHGVSAAAPEGDPTLAVTGARS